MSFESLNIGRTALLTAQYAMEVVGQNVANSGTEGYSRQLVSTKATDATIRSFGAVGTGVTINSIKRASSEYLEQQVRVSTTNSEYYTEMQSGYSTLETQFNELSDNDLSSMIDDFWNAASDVSGQVEDVSTRTAFLETAKIMADGFNSLSDSLTAFRRDIDGEVVSTVANVNDTCKQIANLNVEIVKAEAGGTTGISANDLRDQREVLIKNLSSIMSVNVNEEDNGSVSVSVGTRTLVYGDTTYEVTTKTEKIDDVNVQVPVFAADSTKLDISGGLLGAQMEMRDKTITSYQDDIDQLAASFIWETNRIVSQGTGLQGYTSITGTEAIQNPEDALSSAEYSFDPLEGTYEVENGSMEMLVYDTSTGTATTVNIEIDLDGNTAEPDTILYDKTDPTAANSLINMMQTALDKAAPGVFSVSIDNAGYVSVASNSDQYTFGFGADTSGVVAALGLNTLFTGHDAGTMGVNEMMVESPEMLGCAQSFAQGDNTNINSLLALQDTGVLENDTSTLADYYESIIGRLGTEGSTVDTKVTTTGDLLTYAKNQREQLSGVSTDEEVTYLVQYQRTYQAAAKFITVADECLQTLISM